jgi:hypothetical protein
MLREMPHFGLFFRDSITTSRHRGHCIENPGVFPRETRRIVQHGARGVVI